LTSAEHLLIGAGFRLEEIREGMTLRDFKAFIYLTLKQKLEAQQAQSLGMSLAISSVISEEAGKTASELNTKISDQVNTLDREYKGLYGAGFAERDVGIEKGDSAPRERQPPPPEEDAEFKKAEKTWKILQKLDAGFAKMTGKPTNAPWATYNRANLSTSKFDDIKRDIDRGRGGLREQLKRRGISV